MKWLSGLKRPVALSLAGVLALSALVWFEGPLFAFDGHAPLESESRRWIAVALIFACWAIWWELRGRCKWCTHSSARWRQPRRPF